MLNDRLSQLIDEQTDLFLMKRPQLLDWLALEHLNQKYPDIKEAKKNNKLYVKSVISELHYLLGNGLPEKQMELLLI